ncbi:MAG: M48 family metalloprotease [DPANN group archaeon]|nr:M48 family metalloprotease [DPANN group archaeon]
MSKIIRIILILSVPFILFFCIGRLLGGMTGAFIGLILFGLYSVVSYFYSDKIILRMYGAKELPVNNNDGIYKVIKDLSVHAKIPAPKLYIVDVDTPSVFVCGMRKPFAIAVTFGLVQVCDEREVEAVLSREFAQISGGHVLVSTLSAIFSLAVIYPFEVLWRYGVSQNKYLGIVLRMPALLVAPFAALFVRMGNRRSFSIELDCMGAKLSKKPICLSSALEKISREVKYRPLKVGSHVTSALFISNPFNGSVLSRFFLVHPSLEERIAGLEKLVV